MGNFNIRVYGIWIREGKILVNEESFKGGKIIKFPGGGLDYGEGTIDCLKREWMEELNICPEIIAHFYTTDFFQQSYVDNSQIISIYYLVRCATYWAISNTEPGIRSLWLSLDDLKPSSFTLPIDVIVCEKLLSSGTVR
jgi:8-oxo-dGTP diphosphatase